MPYKGLKHTYGQPRDAFPREDICGYAEDFKNVLHLEREPVGVRFCFTGDEYRASTLPEPKLPMPYCVMVKQAGKGRGFKSRLKHHKCDGGTTALALERSTEKIECGEEYFSYNLYASRAAARRMRSSIKSLHDKQPLTYGILVQPLKDCTETPDVVICVINPYQAMRIIQGYEYQTGIKPKLDIGAMQAMCSEATASPYITGELNLSMMCPSTRMLCAWDESDMAAGIPFEQFVPVVEGIMATQAK